MISTLCCGRVWAAATFLRQSELSRGARATMVRTPRVWLVVCACCVRWRCCGPAAALCPSLAECSERKRTGRVSTGCALCVAADSRVCSQLFRSQQNQLHTSSALYVTLSHATHALSLPLTRRHGFTFRQHTHAHLKIAMLQLHALSATAPRSKYNKIECPKGRPRRVFCAACGALSPFRRA